MRSPTERHRRAPRKAIVGAHVAVLAVAGLGGCDPEIIAPTPAESCEAASGTWHSGDCGGADDACGLAVCETYIGEGCHCDTPGECWDGEACVVDPGLAFEACGDAYRGWPIGCDGSTCCGEDAPCWNGARCVTRATFEGEPR